MTARTGDRSAAPPISSHLGWREFTGSSQPPAAGGLSHMEPPRAGGLSHMEPPRAGGLSHIEHPRAGGLSHMEPPRAGGLSHMEPPRAGGLSHMEPPRAGGLSHMEPPRAGGLSHMEHPRAGGLSHMEHPRAGGLSHMEPPRAGGLSHMEPPRAGGLSHMEPPGAGGLSHMEPPGAGGLGHMEPPSGGQRPAHLMVGEDEALQQFFEDQDVTEVLESSITVDTSILEQYFSNNFMLPESPPDSSSEACSPPRVSDLHYQRSHWSTPGENQENTFLPIASQLAPSSCRFKEPRLAPSDPCKHLTHSQLQSLLTTSCSRADTQQHPRLHPHCHQGAGGHTQADTPPPSHHPTAPHPLHHLPVRPHGLPPPPPPQAPPGGAPVPCQSPGSGPRLAGTYPAGPPHTGPHPDSPGRQQDRKRRRLCSGDVDLDGFYGDGDGGGAGAQGAGHLLTWDPHQPEQWHRLSDSIGQTLPALAFHVETDKGFVFSPADEAFVCQKKNHFQVTVHVGVAGEPRYVATGDGAQPISRFQVDVFGLRLEASSQQVTMEQSQADRSKRPFTPIRISLPGNKITKVTLGRLHFSETTANNMRKKGRPNPDQRYFQMVVALYASVESHSVLLAALRSEKVIVRASNPGQFEVDGDTLWQRGALQEAAVFHGRVGINTDSPDEALVVCGNAKVMGSVMHPSDRRAKENIQEVSSEEQLRRIAQMRIVEYDYRPEFATSMGIDHLHQTGIIAQEVKELLPAAVKEVGDVTCSDGEKIPSFLMVDKEQIFMENVGAVKQLCKLTDDLDGRIKELEGWSGGLARLKSLTGSMRSKGKVTTHTAVAPTAPPKHKPSHVMPRKESWLCLHHKVFQVSVFTLLTTMALCVISITALYLLTLNEDQPGFPDDSGSSVFPIETTAASTPATTPSQTSWPPDVSFCDLLYCDAVFCCPLEAGGSNNTTTSTESPTEPTVDPSVGEDLQKLYEQLKNARDWTNTSIHTFIIKENQQVIGSQYLDRKHCGPGTFSFLVPISQYVPVNMRITLLMNSTELLVVHLCDVEESATCTALLDMDLVTGTRYPSNTQGVHEWPLHVARLHHSSYHFRSTVAGQADCSTDRHSAGALFTDYHFHFYRHCTD